MYSSSYYSTPSSLYRDSSSYRTSSSRFLDATSSTSSGLGSRSYRDSYSNGTSAPSATRYRPPLPTPSYRPITTHSNQTFSSSPSSSTIKNRYWNHSNKRSYFLTLSNVHLLPSSSYSTTKNKYLGHSNKRSYFLTLSDVYPPPHTHGPPSSSSSTIKNR